MSDSFGEWLDRIIPGLESKEDEYWIYADCWTSGRKQAEKEIEELKEENKELKRNVIVGINLHAEELERSIKLAKRIKRLTKALEFYGDLDHWYIGKNEEGYLYASINEEDVEDLIDGGKLARKALAEIKEME